MPPTPTPSPQGPLSAVRVIDITAVFMGTSAMQYLADLGGDVVKVELETTESPESDSVRRIGPQGAQGMGPLFLALNRNKRSICLDLKSPGGLAALKDLVRTADVLAYNVRPQAMERRGLGKARRLLGEIEALVNEVQA